MAAASDRRVCQDLIEESLNKCKPEDQKAILEELLKKQGHSNQTKTFHCRFPIAIVVTLLLATIIPWRLGKDMLIENLVVDPAGLIAALAFVVSLAAYLAGVVREIVKKLSAVSMDMEKKRELKLHAAWVAAAEMQLVLLGVLLIVRVAFEPVWWERSPLTFRFDNFLPIYFGLIMLFLSGLHARIWWVNEPFSIPHK
jgi:hypothetical protein